MDGQVIEFAPRSTRRTRTPAQTRAVTLAMSHASYLRVMEAAVDLVVSASNDAFTELVSTMLSSITAGDSPDLRDALAAMVERRIADLEPRRASPTQQGPQGLSIANLHGLSTRTYTVLDRAGIDTIADLFKLQSRGFTSVRGVGPKSADEIKTALTDERNRRYVRAAWQQPMEA